MQTIEEYQAYTKQLEGEVKTWHDAYDAMTVERNLLIDRVKELEKQLNQKGNQDVHQRHNNGLQEDCKRNFTRGGVKTELEVALAKKCLRLHEKLVEVNNQRNEFLEGLYTAFLRIEKAGGEALKTKRLADLDANSKAAFKRAVKLNGELKEIINGEQETADVGKPDCEA